MKVLLIVFAVCISLALGGLCMLGILYVSVSVQLSAQETNGTIMAIELEELTANYTRVKEHLRINNNYKAQFDVLSNQHEETLRKLNRFNQSTGCALCAIHWIHSGGKCYYFSTVKMNWTQSRDYCVTLGAHLVIINSKAEQDFVTSNVEVTSWIGLNDLDTEGHWVWVNNQPLNNSVEFWIKRKDDTSEPDNWTKVHPDGEDCASLGHPNGETDFWTDAYCFEEKRLTPEMDSIYENSNVILSTVASDEKCSQYKGYNTKVQESERKVYPPKWKKVLLIAFAVCISLALGGLCILGILCEYKPHTHTLISFMSVLQCSCLPKKLMAQAFSILAHPRCVGFLLQGVQPITHQLFLFFTAVMSLSSCCIAHCQLSQKSTVFFYKMNTQENRISWSLKNLQPTTPECSSALSTYISALTTASYTTKHSLTCSATSMRRHLESRTDLIDFVTSNVEGHWVWVNNQPLNNSVEFWIKRKDEISEPDNWTKVHPDGEDCASLGHPNGETDFWTDAYCFEEKRLSVLTAKIKETHWIGLENLDNEMNNQKELSVINHWNITEMDSMYENSSFILSTVASDVKCSQYKGNSTEMQENEREVYLPKWTKVLLIVFAVCLLFALGVMTRQLEELTTNYTRVREQLNINNIMVRKSEELKANYTKVREQLSFYEAFKAQSLNCDMTSTTFKGKLYFFSCDKLNWLCSRAFCVSKGADLVTITSQTEQRFLLSKIKDWNWIGLNDLETEGHWVWVNNQTLNETGVQFWHKRTSEKSEPDNWKEDDHTGENCAIVKNDVNYLDRWFDVSCNYQMKFICEKKYQFASVTDAN
ncbi:C-type lectin domain family 4 member E [Labeo rohita]|uniref:C-type lectin domain family 4 member E n=1 Tax=Labeo rohita TaxID=84645 RepID=A0ABQ8LR50_LABRO|nr:C-type lectin domain family 4 member E [Labeo rohita]